MYRSLSGIAPKDVEIAPVQTKFGTFEGGYFPIIWHPVLKEALGVDGP